MTEMITVKYLYGEMKLKEFVPILKNFGDRAEF